MRRSHVFLARAPWHGPPAEAGPQPAPGSTLDRVEAAVGAGLAIAFLAGAPLAAIAAGHFASSVGSRADRSQQAVRHQVPAVVLALVPASGPRSESGSSRWVAPDGRQRTGHVAVPRDAKARAAG